MMLAQRGTPADLRLLQERGYLFDLKIDGVRCRATVKDGVVRLTSRQGVPVTECYPEVVEALQRQYSNDGKWVFDGELAVNDERGLPSWPLTHKRAMQSGRRASQSRVTLPATFYAFDVLHHNGEDVTGLGFAERRKLLDGEAGWWAGSPLQAVLHGATAEAMWSVVTQYRLEGLVAKRASSRYRDGRTSDWIKVKRTSTVSCLVGGYDAGEGSRANTFGALHLYLMNPAQRLVPVGKVGSGFSNAELKTVMHALHHPPLIVEVKYLDVSPDGQLRQPVFLRVRDDLAIHDCTTDQLTTY